MIKTENPLFMQKNTEIPLTAAVASSDDGMNIYLNQIRRFSRASVEKHDGRSVRSTVR